MGQRVIPVAVTAEYIGGDGVTLGAAGSHNSVLIEYDFRSAGPQWDDISGRYVLWTNPQGNSTNRINLGISEKVEGYEGVYQAAPPADAMCVPGWAEMVVVGYTLNGETEVTKIKTEPSRFRVLTGSSRAADNEGVAPTVADQLQAEIEAVNDSLESKKVNKPTTPYSENGTKGQILETLGDGSTRWRDETVATTEIVDEVLREHPDWVTTVEDGAISEAKLADAAVSEDKLGQKVKEKMELLGVKSHSIIPVYVGDYMSSPGHIAACCVRIGDYMYCVDTRPAAAAATNRDDYGTVRKFNMVNNVEVTDFRKSVLVGHANSITYDPTNRRIYISPVATFTSGAAISVTRLYVYDEDFNYLESIDIPEASTGVAYDHVTGQLYTYNNATKKVYRLGSEDEWELYSEIDFSAVKKNNKNTGSYNQDFAVYGDVFYISSPSRNIIYGKLQEGASAAFGAFNVVDMDTSGRFRCGELEGMEFTQDGRLYASCFLQIYTAYSACVNTIVTELDVGTALIGLPNVGDSGLYYFPQRELILSNGAKNSFALQATEIRSLVQLNFINRGNKTVKVTVPAGESVEDPYDINILDDLYLIVNGELIVNRFVVYRGTLSIATTTTAQAEGEHKITVNATYSAFQIRYSAGLKFVGDRSVIVSMPNYTEPETGPYRNFINVYSDYPITLVRVVPTSSDSIEFYIGDSQLSSGMFVGGTKIWPLPQS